jgi:lysophospholipase L1-like esterase
MIYSSAREPDRKPMKIVLVGDSTVADYKPESVMRGWGQELKRFVKPPVKIANLAICGKSTKTYFEGGNWAKALEQKADYIFIQFGHNDSHAKEKPESTDADTTYMENLRRYVSETRAAGSIPVLVTPMHRLRFLPENGKLTTELQSYADAMKRVAIETNTPVIDLYVESGRIFEPMGDAGVAGLTVSDRDRTHFTEKGAEILAEVVAREAVKIEPRLAGVSN